MMNGILRALLVVGCLSICLPVMAAGQQGPRPPRQLEMKQWHDAIGLFPFEARMIGFADGVVQLRQKDRTLLRIPIERLSEWDRQYVREHAGAIPAAIDPGANADRPRPFPEARLKKMLLSRNEKARLGAMREIAQQHVGDARAAALMLDRVQKIDLQREPTTIDLIAIRMLAYFDRPEVTAALLELLGKVCLGEPSEYTVAVFAALEGHDRPEVDRAMLRTLEALDYRLVMLAAHLLGRHRNEEAFEKLTALTARPEFKTHFGFRQCVFEAVAQYGNRRSVDFFVRHLPGLDGQLKKFAVDYLTLVCRRPFGGNAKAWTEWWSTHQSQFGDDDSLARDERSPGEDPSPGEQVSPGDNYTWDYRTPEFYGHRIYAMHVIFVIDCSSTMTKRLRRGRIKLDEAKRQLVGAIMSLPTDATFNVVYFNRTIDAFSPKPIVATPESRQWAVERVSALQWQRGTAISGALDLAFRLDPQLEAIYLVSDGQPTVGVTDPQTILRLVGRANTFRYIRVNTVGIGDDRKPLMWPLAHQNYGVYRHAK